MVEQDQTAICETYKDPADRFILCKIKTHYRPLALCPNCKRFPCISITREYYQALVDSLFTDKTITHFAKERLKMTKYIFLHKDGSMTEAPRDFDPEHPDFSKLSDVASVVPYNKLLVPQMKLVVKSLDDIRKIKEQQNTAPATKRGGRKNQEA